MTTPLETHARLSGLVAELLHTLGEDIERPGLRDTPTRVALAMSEWFGGYSEDPAEMLKSIEDGARGYDQMVVLTDIPVYSHCEHHMAPFFGVAHVGYIPRGKIVGLSKLARLVDI